MDPAATICALLEGGMSHTERAEYIGALNGWYAARGYRPSVSEVARIFYRRNPDRNWTRSMESRARKYGAKP